MAIAEAHVTVTTSATLIAAPDPDAQVVKVKNIGSASVFVGDASVTTANGYEIAAGATETFTLVGAEALYGIVASATQTVEVFRSQVG